MYMLVFLFDARIFIMYSLGGAVFFVGKGMCWRAFGGMVFAGRFVKIFHDNFSPWKSLTAN